MGAQIWSGLVALGTLPLVMRGLGAEGYGLVALVLSALSTAALGDLGVGRAVAKYIAERSETGAREDADPWVHTGLTLTLVLGGLAGLSVWAAGPWLATHALRTPASLREPAEEAFQWVAAALPGVLLRGLGIGILLAKDRQAPLNAALALANTAKMLLAAAVVLAGRGVVAVVAVHVVITYLHAAALGALVFAGQAPVATLRLQWNPATVRVLLRFGSWGTLAAGLSQTLLQADRWVLGMLSSLEAVGYYSAAWELCSKQCWLSASISRTFFPLFAERYRRGKQSFARVYERAGNLTIASTTGLAVLLALFARPLLTVWVGAETANQASGVMALLALAFLLSGYLVIPFVAITAGPGRPDVLTRLYGAGVVTHLVLSVAGAYWLGPAGVAGSLLLVFGTLTWAAARWIGSAADLPRGHHGMLAAVAKAAAAGLAVGVPLRFFAVGWLHDLAAVVMLLTLGYAAYLGLAFYLCYPAEERLRVGRQARALMGAIGA